MSVNIVCFLLCFLFSLGCSQEPGTISPRHKVKRVRHQGGGITTIGPNGTYEHNRVVSEIDTKGGTRIIDSTTDDYRYKGTLTLEDGRQVFYEGEGGVMPTQKKYPEK